MKEYIGIRSIFLWSECNKVILLDTKSLQSIIESMITIDSANY